MFNLFFFQKVQTDQKVFWAKYFFQQCQDDLDKHISYLKNVWAQNKNFLRIFFLFKKKNTKKFKKILKNFLNKIIVILFLLYTNIKCQSATKMVQ